MSTTTTRVESISQTGSKSVPPEYIQPTSTRPTPPSSLPIPTLDLSLPRNDAVLSHLFSDWGAFHVINHSIPLPLLHSLRRVSRHFFTSTPIPDKLRFACDPTTPASQGYGSKMLAGVQNDTVLDWRDYFDHHTLPHARRNPASWPDSPPDYRAVVGEYSDRMMGLARKMMGLMSESLGLEYSRIEEAVGEIYQNITVSFYPPCPQPELTLGLQAHSDFGAITLLVQDEVEGLEILKDGEWITVQPLDDAVLVILGDQTEVLTNGKYRSVVHRAITNASRSRLSIATFHDPAKTREISPVFEPPRYRNVLYGDYVSSWYTKGPEGKRNIDALLL